MNRLESNDHDIAAATAKDARARRVESSRLRILLFKGLQSDNPDDRAIALERIIDVTKSYIHAAYPPNSPSKASAASTDTSAPNTPNPGQSNFNGYLYEQDKGFPQTSVERLQEFSENDTELPSDPETEEAAENLHNYLLTIVRLSITCPFRDVRKTFKDLLRKLKESAITIPEPVSVSPSFFVHPEDVFSLESSSSAHVFYPRPANISISPWSDGTSSIFSNDHHDTIINGGGPLVEADDTCHSDDDTPMGQPSDQYIRDLMVKNYLDSGRLSNTFRLLAFFPTFFEKFDLAYHQIMRSSVGPLERTWRSYLGLLAAAEHKCQYLVSLQKLYFLQYGGDPSWLKGIQYAPLKLRNISTLMIILARQPWALTENHFHELLHCSNGGNPVTDSWTKSELIQAIVVIATFHGLSSFVLGCGIVPEIDTRGGYFIAGAPQNHQSAGIEHELDEHIVVRRPLPNEHDAFKAAASATGWNDDSDEDRLVSKDHEAFSSDMGLGLGVRLLEGDDNWEKHQFEDVVDEDTSSSDVDDLSNTVSLRRTSVLISILKKKKESGLKDLVTESLAVADEQLDTLPEETANGLEDDHHVSFAESPSKASRISTLSIHTNASSDGSSSSTYSSKFSPRANIVLEDLDRFLDPTANAKIQRTKFSQSDDRNEFMLSEYCWEDEGCDIINQFLPGIGDCLDAEFDEVVNISDWSIFHQTESSVDTGPLRSAMWYYALKLFGVTKEDYDYSDISTYLTNQNKAYIQKVCYTPQDIRYHDWKNFGLSLRDEEKCHVNLLTVQAKKQAILIYGLSTISQI
ncbi:PA26 p53-induced protein-domain-containing protein [Umbelopsis sp. PMI_123]|nr:PA26 p53-induced protein-domain-containing protein [Umbelopsis sp. PMI_123]